MAWILARSARRSWRRRPDLGEPPPGAAIENNRGNIRAGETARRLETADYGLLPSVFRKRESTRRRFWPRSIVWAGAGLLVWLAAACGDSPRSVSSESAAVRSSARAPLLPVAERIAPQVIAELFTSLRSGDVSAALKPLLSGERQLSQGDPHWPTVTYLVGEAQRLRGQPDRARFTFRALAAWATSGSSSGPYGDTWGGSGLAAIGLWRWLQLLEPHAAEDRPEIKAEVDHVLSVAAALAETRLFSGMVRSPDPLPALPLVREDVARRLAHVAWKAKRPQAQALFLDFLAIDSGARLDAVDTEILAKLQSRLSPERLSLFRARRLLELVKTEAQKLEAARTLEALWEDRNAPADVRAEAGYEWANFNRRVTPLRPRLVEVLTSTFALAAERGPVGERALYLRGLVHNLEPGANVEAFRADMNEYLRRYPQGQVVDDAHFQLATDALFRLDTGNALSAFQRLRDLPDPNKYRDSASFLPALGLVGRNGPGDLEAADKLLQEYLQRYPDGVFRLRCLFWRARIAERRKDGTGSQALFRQTADEAPYDYYGLRARMHLEDGEAAIGKDLPKEDSSLRRELRQAYRQSRVDTGLVESTPYHARLQTIARGGLYGDLLKIESRLTERLDDIPLARADERGLIPAAALLLASRLDAAVARDSDFSADNRLRLAAVLGREVGDWPVAIAMTSGGDGRRERLTSLQRDPRYLATMYSSLDRLKAVDQALAGAAWPIDGSPAVSQSLMYAVMRHESGFYPSAISRVGALGLFQFLPSTFVSLDRAWRLRQSAGVQSMVEYLLDPQRNTSLWARWMKTEFKLGHRNEIATVMMKHQAGAIATSIDFWNRLGAAGDVEFRVETVRFNATRNFVRLVLQDTIIVDAAGFLESRPGG